MHTGLAISNINHKKVKFEIYVKGKYEGIAGTSLSSQIFLKMLPCAQDISICVIPQTTYIQDVKRLINWHVKKLPSAFL